ncbi:hypothetical protein B0J15DRAFT_460706 [Fusarium solani]|uniref:Uncharacterized protein n=1 Tax=Fusarium solani TaxID=169388 RepID=A0A9P9RBR0_FUSSL|nr:uncharacterized protein B0J15DRAFT_460706 [Fusarium solani]KAH7272979.1 hypothetical protein B0J15DRAFT_460706 [Fusarium solani]
MAPTKPAGVSLLSPWRADVSAQVRARSERVPQPAASPPPRHQMPCSQRLNFQRLCRVAAKIETAHPCTVSDPCGFSSQMTGLDDDILMGPAPPGWASKVGYI